VLAAVEGDGSCIVNALTEAQHRGDANDYGRPGHLPGAANVAAVDLVDPATQRYLPLEELRRRFEPALSEGDGRVITYCGGGIAASSDAFVLHRLGRHDVAVYDGSLQEWAADPSLPLVTGD
jgi:thiosulfate/3-mercaptopyruvate sulfurtransferase